MAKSTLRTQKKNQKRMRSSSGLKVMVFGLSGVVGFSANPFGVSNAAAQVVEDIPEVRESEQLGRRPAAQEGTQAFFDATVALNQKQTELLKDAYELLNLDPFLEHLPEKTVAQTKIEFSSELEDIITLSEGLFTSRGLIDFYRIARDSSVDDRNEEIARYLLLEPQEGNESGQTPALDEKRSELEDMTINVEAWSHSANMIVRSLGLKEYEQSPKLRMQAEASGGELAGTYIEASRSVYEQVVGPHIEEYKHFQYDLGENDQAAFASLFQLGSIDSPKASQDLMQKARAVVDSRPSISHESDGSENINDLHISRMVRKARGAEIAYSALTDLAVATVLNLNIELEHSIIPQVVNEPDLFDSYTGAEPHNPWGYSGLALETAIDKVDAESNRLGQIAEMNGKVAEALDDAWSNDRRLGNR